MQNSLNQIFFGNRLFEYIIALGIFIIGLILIEVFKSVVLRKLNRWAEATETKLDDLLVKGIQKTIIPLLRLWAFYLALDYLKIEGNTMNVINKIAAIVFTFFILRAISSAIRVSLNLYVKKRSGESPVKRN